jgi:hypothetical protein
MNSHHAGKNPMRSDRDVQPNPDVIAKQIDDECVLVHLGTDRIYRLNRTGARVWELLSAGYDRVGVHERMLQEFEVDPDQLVREIDGLLTSLQDEGLVTVRTGE